jgi:ABC-type Fe3+ transport system substrate-binding protein
MSLTIEVKYYNNPNVITYNLTWAPNMNIQNAMEQCYNQYGSPHAQNQFTFTVQYLGTYSTQYIGYAIEAINQQQKSGSFIWNTYVNGAVINNSLDGYILQPGDVIEFKYETYSS